MFALWAKPQRELKKMVHITYSNLNECNKMNTCNLIVACYLISVHCILSSCLIPNWEQTLIKDNQREYLSKDVPQETTTMQNLSI